MRYEFDLARSFMKSVRSKKHYHPHIWLSILGIIVGVSFLIFALSIYDGYVKKIETIIFSFYPQITLQSQAAVDEEDTLDDDLLLLEEKKDNRCETVCSGQSVLEDRTLLDEDDSANHRFDLKIYPQLKHRLLTIPGIKQISPIIFEEADFVYSYTTGKQNISEEGPLRILGVQHQGETFVPEIERTITNRSLLKRLANSNAHYVILSAELYRKFFKELPPEGTVDDGSKKIRLRRKRELNQNRHEPGKQVELIVAGVFKLGMHKISENMMITSLAAAQEILSMERHATFLGVSLKEPYRAERIADEIKQLTAANENKIQIYHWMAVAADMFNSLSLYRKIVIIVLLISVLITSFNIYTTLNIMILERKKQIGVLMSMGIKRGSLYRTFVIISQIEAVIGVVLGTAAGVLLGIYFSDYFNRSLQAFLYIRDAGTVVSGGTVVLIFCFVCLLCGVTAFAATRKGAHLDPVEALRSE